MILSYLNFVFSTTIRSRNIKEVFNPEEGVKFAKAHKRGKFSWNIIWFGKAGLNKKEISYSNAIISIVSEKFKSLNLSHAVGIISYEWFKNSKNNGAEKTDELINLICKKIHIEKFVLKLKSTTKKRLFLA